MNGGYFVYALYGHDCNMNTTIPNCAYRYEDEARKAADNEPSEWLIKAIWIVPTEDR